METQSSSKARRWLIALAAVSAVVLFAAVAVGAAVATDRSAFCTSCHEMQPYHQAWATGAHANVPCVDCHVNRGIVAHLEHKIIALGEVKTHFFAQPTFPVAEAPEVPDDRCVACHSSVTVSRPGFSHAEHARKGPCQSCHADAGHDVSAEALAAAGILNESTFRARASARTATVGKGAANLVGHVKTDCESCHDMKASRCKSCHTAKHAARKQDCVTCHQPGAKFVFAHPASPSCTECHAKPAKHSSAACTGCHPKPGVTWGFDHVLASNGANCESCHPRPAEHKAGACSTCHKSGASWVFAHPSSEACATCHRAPAKHYGTDCAKCHTPTVPFARTTLTHPAASATCTDCHKRPAGHRAGACITCHPRVGANWAFAHPGSTACATCHKAPAGHRAGACTTCHKVGPKWAFSHPGPSATCTACHKVPAGHSTASCTTCHRVSATWAFYHPSSTACSSCHRAPAGHSTAACTTCHKVGPAWTFSHPGASATCTSCHARPTGHAGGTCTTCHRVSATWAFYHPSSTACASCHSAPANHYGTSCASCHSVGVPWANATFRHPAISGGEHTYRSFACVNCHPNGYSSATCIKCHDTPTGPGADD